jgi:hypothetical protein
VEAAGGGDGDDCVRVDLKDALVAPGFVGFVLRTAPNARLSDCFT